MEESKEQPEGGHMELKSIDYDSLPEVKYPIEEYMRRSMELLKSNEWREQMEGLSNLRSLNKHEFSELARKLPDFHAFIIQGMENSRSHVSKMAHQLVNELFLHDMEEAENMAGGSWLQIYCPQIIPPLFTMSIKEKRFISSLAREAIGNLVVNCLCKEAVLSISELVHIKHPLLCERAVEALDTLMFNAKNTLDVLLPILTPLLNNLLRETNAGRAKVKKSLKHIFQMLKERVGVGELGQIVQEGDFTKKQRELYQQWVHHKVPNTQNGSSSCFKQFLREKQLGLKGANNMLQGVHMNIGDNKQEKENLGINGDNVRIRGDTQ